jgi:nucleoid-associated protein YgaU
MLALSVACGSFLIYLGAHNGAGKVRPSAGIQQDPVNTSAAPSPESLSALPVADASGDPQPREFSRTGAVESLSTSFTYVVQPKDTLRDLCVSTLGRYDKVVLSKIRELNPDLRNPDHLDVGQVIHFPLNPPK